MKGDDIIASGVHIEAMFDTPVSVLAGLPAWVWLAGAVIGGGIALAPGARGRGRRAGRRTGRSG